jgi:chemotaxis protein MotB
MAKGGKQDEVAPIIVKKIKKGGGGHHGGAWKVAYADFVTAMMAFFLLLWLLNVTTKEQKAGLADYFDPVPKVSKTTESGAGGILGGLNISKDGAMINDMQTIVEPETAADPALRAKQDPLTDEKFKEETRRREEENFKKAEAEIQKAMAESPDLKDLQKNLMVDMTNEGLRIQIVDQEGDPMFPSGSAQMYTKTEKLMAKLAETIARVPNEISVRGHTDGVPYAKGRTYGNWELSAERANASRRVLIANGFPEKRINNVLGKADRDHLVANNPNDAKNRRISIILLREELTVQVGANRSTEAVKRAEEEKKNPQYRRTRGEVEFP